MSYATVAGKLANIADSRSQVGFVEVEEVRYEVFAYAHSDWIRFSTASYPHAASLTLPVEALRLALEAYEYAHAPEPAEVVA